MIESLALALAIAAASPAKGPPPVDGWETVSVCRSDRTASPGRGQFWVRAFYKKGGLDHIDVRGCGETRFHKRLGLSTDEPWRIYLYAIPFYNAKKFDFLIEWKIEDGPVYTMLAEKDDYAATFEFDAVAAVFFGDENNDGRWEILTHNIRGVSCRERAWRDENWTEGKAFDADNVCR